jgi:hypothetical protein
MIQITIVWTTNGSIIFLNRTGLSLIYDPRPHGGDLGFAPPEENIESFLYKPCDCVHHFLPICCLTSIHHFAWFANNPNQYLRIDFAIEYLTAIDNYNEKDITREPNNR